MIQRVGNSLKLAQVLLSEIAEAKIGIFGGALC